MTKTQHKPNKELVGQGIGNMVAGLFGGLPGAGATIRTVVNIQAGGRTRLSGMITGLLLVVIVIALAPLASMIPAAVLVGILITVGIGVIDYKGLRALRRMDISEAFILLLVLFVTVFYDLIAAVGVGLVIASVVFMKRMSDLSEEEVEVYDLSHSEEKEAVWEDESSIPDSIREKVVFKHLSGPMFFGFATHFKNLLADLGDLHVVVIRMRKVPFMDQSGVYALEASIEDLRAEGVLVVITEPNEQVMEKMKGMKIIPRLVSENHVFNDFKNCKVWLKEVISSEEKLAAELALLN
jgi:SulP family sulfate permease